MSSKSLVYLYAHFCLSNYKNLIHAEGCIGYENSSNTFQSDARDYNYSFNDLTNFNFFWCY